MSIHQHTFFPVRYFYPNVPIYPGNQPPFYGINSTIPPLSINPFSNYENGTCSMNKSLCNQCVDGSFPVVSNDHCYCATSTSSSTQEKS